MSYNPDPNPNNPYHNHAPRRENSVQQIQLSVPWDENTITCG